MEATTESREQTAATRPSSDEVAARAYRTYVEEGSPEGQHEAHWLAAEAELISEQGLSGIQP